MQPRERGSTSSALHCLIFATAERCPPGIVLVGRLAAELVGQTPSQTEEERYSYESQRSTALPGRTGFHGSLHEAGIHDAGGAFGYNDDRAEHYIAGRVDDATELA